MTFLIQSKSPGNVIEISRIHGNPRICNLDAGDTPYQEVYQGKRAPNEPVEGHRLFCE